MSAVRRIRVSPVPLQQSGPHANARTRKVLAMGPDEARKRIARNVAKRRAARTSSPSRSNKPSEAAQKSAIREAWPAEPSPREVGDAQPVQRARWRRVMRKLTTPFRAIFARFRA